MTERSIDPLSHVLGGIEQQLKMIATTQAEDRNSAARYRTDVRKEIGGLREDVSGMQSNLTTVSRAVEKMEPKVDALEEKRLMSAGAHRLAEVLTRFAHVISAMIGGALVWALQHFFGPR